MAQDRLCKPKMTLPALRRLLLTMNRHVMVGVQTARKQTFRRRRLENGLWRQAIYQTCRQCFGCRAFLIRAALALRCATTVDISRTMAIAAIMSSNHLVQGRSNCSHEKNRTIWLVRLCRVMFLPFKPLRRSEVP